MTQALCVYNPAAGKAPLARHQLQAMVSRLQSFGLEVDTLEARPNGSTSDALQLDGADLLVIFGGDGTIHSVLPEAVRCEIPVAVIPSGTANVLARELGIPLHTEEALQLILEGTLKEVFVGRADGRFFHLMGGIGPDAYLNQRVSPALKRRLGILAFWWTGLTRFWSYRLEPFQVRVDGGREQQATFAVVSNARFYGGHLKVAPQASVLEESLDVCLFSARRHGRYVRYLLASLKGRHLTLPDVFYRKARRIEVYGNRSVAVQLDGETVGSLPRTFSMEGDSVRIYVPGS
jgi:YegS/Rv2252/BmrU family lipid kinase